jgi:hypothetical protein
MSSSEKTICDVEKLVASLPPEDRERFARMFHVTTTIGKLKAPESMHKWIEGLFGSVDAVREQRIVQVTNLITLDGALFNDLRARRPMETQMAAHAQEAIDKSVGDPFCHPNEGTPEDVFGRVRGVYGTTASNVAKYDGFHGLVIFDEHDPLRFTEEQVGDYIDTALAWAREAHSVDNEARYFFFMWNCLWKSGASIIHGHAQMTLSRGMHYARVEHLRRSALLYRLAHSTNYFEDLLSIHESLGLGFKHGSVRGCAYLAPIKEKEVLLVSPTINGDLKHAIYKVLDTFVHKLSVQSFNLALYRSPIDSVQEDWSEFPVVVRIVDRGDLGNRTADIGAMELYASSVISSDPFRVAEQLREQ